MSKKSQSSVERPEDDFYPTPREAVWPLTQVITPIGKVWEPMCGEGHISEVLKEVGFEVVSSNLHDRGYGQTGIDFFAQTSMPKGCRTVITNPAFSCAEEAVLHSLRLGAEVVAMFLRTKFLEGITRHREIFSQYPHSWMYQFIDRVVIKSGDTPADEQPGQKTEAFAWYVWQRGYLGPPRTGWIKTNKGLQYELLAAE